MIIERLRSKMNQRFGAQSGLHGGTLSIDNLHFFVQELGNPNERYIRVSADDGIGAVDFKLDEKLMELGALQVSSDQVQILKNILAEEKDEK